MNIRITFRHMDPSDAIKRYARAKLAKLQKFHRQPMSAKVTMSLEKLKHVAEVGIATGGDRYEAKEASEDLYASIDKVVDKLERQIRGAKGAQRSRKRRGQAGLKKSAKKLARKATPAQRGSTEG